MPESTLALLAALALSRCSTLALLLSSTLIYSRTLALFYSRALALLSLQIRSNLSSISPGLASLTCSRPGNPHLLSQSFPQISFPMEISPPLSLSSESAESIINPPQSVPTFHLYHPLTGQPHLFIHNSARINHTIFVLETRPPLQPTPRISPPLSPSSVISTILCT